MDVCENYESIVIVVVFSLSSDWVRVIILIPALTSDPSLHLELC